MGNERSESLHSLEELTDRTRQQFLSTETWDPTLPAHPDHGKIRIGYRILHAAGDIVNKLPSEGVDTITLLSRAIKESALPFDPTIDWDLNGFDSWEEFVGSILDNIVERETLHRFPELHKEEQRRMEIYNED